MIALIEIDTRVPAMLYPTSRPHKSPVLVHLRTVECLVKVAWESYEAHPGLMSVIVIETGRRLCNKALCRYRSG